MKFWTGGWDVEQTHELKKAISFVQFLNQENIMLDSHNFVVVRWCSICYS